VVIHRSYVTDCPVDFVGQSSSNGGVSFESLFEVTSARMATSWANADKRAFRMPLGIRFPFDLRVSSVALLADRPEQAKVYDTDADRIREAYATNFLNPETGVTWRVP